MRDSKVLMLSGSVFVSPPRAFVIFLVGKLRISAVGPADLCKNWTLAY